MCTERGPCRLALVSGIKALEQRWAGSGRPMACGSNFGVVGQPLPAHLESRAPGATGAHSRPLWAGQRSVGSGGCSRSLHPRLWAPQGAGAGQGFGVPAAAAACCQGPGRVPALPSQKDREGGRAIQLGYASKWLSKRLSCHHRTADGERAEAPPPPAAPCQIHSRRMCTGRPLSAGAS